MRKRHGESGEEFVRTEVQFIPAKLKVIDHYRETYDCRACRKRGEPYMEKRLYRIRRLKPELLKQDYLRILKTASVHL